MEQRLRFHVNQEAGMLVPTAKRGGGRRQTDQSDLSNLPQKKSVPPYLLRHWGRGPDHRCNFKGEEQRTCTTGATVVVALPNEKPSCGNASWTWVVGIKGKQREEESH